MAVEASGHGARRTALAARVAQLRAASGAGAAPLALSKRTSNLFRDRAAAPRRRLDLNDFDHVLEVDVAAGWVDAEGMATFETMVDATLPHRVMPAVVPQLKTITIGGAAAGVGIEATSFREGLVHDTLLELDVLLPDGDVVRATPDNAHRDLFYGFPNSYGTLGYALRLRQRTLPIKPFVRIAHRRFAAADAFFAALAAEIARPRSDPEAPDFVDGVVFDGGTLVLTTGTFADEAPRVSDYTAQAIYYRSLLAGAVDWLTTHDYIWRWDTDWFWCSKNVGAQNPLLRPLFGRRRLNSRTYTKLMRFNSRWGITRRISALRGRHPESVIQDLDIPLSRAPEFLAFLLREIDVLPIWTCPIRGAGAGPAGTAPRFALYPLASAEPYVNFGFWDVIDSRVAHERGHFNRLLEREVERLGGIKSLYSDSYFTRDEFARAYDMTTYTALKAKYDPNGRLPGLYEKCVLAA